MVNVQDFNAAVAANLSIACEGKTEDEKHILKRHAAFVDPIRGRMVSLTRFIRDHEGYGDSSNLEVIIVPGSRRASRKIKVRRAKVIK